MSREPRWAQICNPEEATSLDPLPFCVNVEPVRVSPIDDFYSYIQEVLPLGTEDELTKSKVLGRVLLLGLVSGVELYLRSALSGVLEICPLSREHAAKCTLSVSSLDYYGSARIGLGLLEGVSFAADGEIKRQTDKLVNISWQPTSSVGVAITVFEGLCHFRHAAVHSRGELSAGNLRALKITERSSRKSLSLGLPQLHQAARICQTAVRAYNRHVYRQLVEKWISQGILAGDWKKDKQSFERLFKLFHSQSDMGRTIKAFHAYSSLRSVLVERAGRL